MFVNKFLPTNHKICCQLSFGIYVKICW